jgi:hypothetical protein
MKVTIILDGGLKSCCSSYSPELVREVVRGWLKRISGLRRWISNKEI